MGILSRLFGGSKSSEGTGGAGGPSRGEPVAYEGLTIEPAPEPAGDQWRLAGYIIDQNDDDLMERKFLRADTFSTRDEAEQFSVRKGQQIIDEQGRRMFASGEPHGRV